MTAADPGLAHLTILCLASGVVAVLIAVAAYRRDRKEGRR